jgi:hypothetical protein
MCLLKNEANWIGVSSVRVKLFETDAESVWWVRSRSRMTRLVPVTRSATNKKESWLDHVPCGSSFFFRQTRLKLQSSLKGIFKIPGSSEYKPPKQSRPT